MPPARQFSNLHGVFRDDKTTGRDRMDVPRAEVPAPVAARDNPLPVWGRLQKQARMARVVKHYQAISADMDAASREFCDAERAVWNEHFLAKRERRKPNPAPLRQQMAAQAKLDALRVETRVASGAQGFQGHSSRR